jgi:hypothetical protein
MHVTNPAHFVLDFVNLIIWQRGLAVAEAVSRWLRTAAARVLTRVWQVGFVVDKVASGQVFSEYFGFPCQNRLIPPTSPSSQSPGAVSRGLATSWSPIRGVLPTVLDLVTEMKWPRPKNWAVEPQKKRDVFRLFTSSQHVLLEYEFAWFSAGVGNLRLASHMRLFGCEAAAL